MRFFLEGHYFRRVHAECQRSAKGRRMTPREAELDREYRDEMRRCDRMELVGWVLMVLGVVIAAVSVVVMR